MGSSPYAIKSRMNEKKMLEQGWDQRSEAVRLQGEGSTDSDYSTLDASDASSAVQYVLMFGESVTYLARTLNLEFLIERGKILLSNWLNSR